MNILTTTSDFKSGFDSSSDIFDRRRLYTQMIRLIKNSPDKSLVFALDDRWGNGKTSFVKMMQSEIELNEKDNLNVIYFDAFENDYQSDPFISISAELYSLLDAGDSTTKKIGQKIAETGKKLGASLFINGSKLAITALTAGLVNGTVLEQAGEAISDSVSSELESFIEDKIKSMEQEKQNIIDFKTALEDIHKKTNKKTLIIIDEMDRARPDYSLDLLEKVKHLFSVEGLVFLIVMNREQFEKGISYRYGNIDSSLYLNKFIHYWFTLPKISFHSTEAAKRPQNTTIANYIKLIINNNPDFKIAPNGIFAKTLSYLVDANGCSLREVERCFSVLSVIDNPKDISLINDKHYLSALALVCFLKVANPSKLDSLLRKKTGVTEFLNLINTTDNRFHNSFEGIVLIELLNYHFTTDQELENTRKTNPQKFESIEGGYINRINIIEEITETLDNMHIDF